MDDRIEIVACVLSQTVISGTKDRDPDSRPWGTSGMKAWESWRKPASAVIAALDAARPAPSAGRCPHCGVDEGGPGCDWIECIGHNSKPAPSAVEEALAERLRSTTEEMANNCHAPMLLWDRHSNACLDAVAALSAARKARAGQRTPDRKCRGPNGCVVYQGLGCAHRGDSACQYERFSVAVAKAKNTDLDLAVAKASEQYWMEQALEQDENISKWRDQFRATCEDNQRRLDKLIASLMPKAREASAGQSAQDDNTLPWKRPELAAWSIVGMNHYHISGIRYLFVAMSKDGMLIKAESVDDDRTWDDLATAAKATEEKP